MNSTVSVIIPAYRQPELLAEAVKSVHNQTYRDIELIVIDDSDTGHGASWARNQGIKRASGSYIALLDQDDEYDPDKIEKSIKFMEVYNCGMMHHNARIVNQPLVWHGSQAGEIDIVGFNYHTPGKCKNLLWRNYICNSTPVIKRACFNEIGLFDEKLFISADWDMWLRIEEQYQIKYLNMSLTNIRSYPMEVPHF